MTRHYLLFGANSAIAKAYISHILVAEPSATIYAVSRQNPLNNAVEYLHCNYSPESLNRVSEQLQQLNVRPHQIILFNGVLHTPIDQPEKRLEDIDANYFQQLITANTLTPLLCLQAVFPLLNHNHDCTITAFSARVGSIEDNQLGGWYSYRASKSALNMLFKTAAIELSRRSKKTRLVLFHPGTTDTELSKPFQKNVPEHKLFSPEFVAKQLFDLLSNAQQFTKPNDPAYIDWQGQPINW
ncbi:SDR family NAD(P)-dependent oxidoreductase [Reinekea forsetii]|nr:SDR family NAD(P)-dependent oxidoreductase [Reinekea forsetii]